MRFAVKFSVLGLWVLGLAGPAAAQYTIHEGMQNLPNKGPETALGLVIWSHGSLGHHDASRFPPPPYIGVLMGAGWDVRRIARDAMHETGGWSVAGMRHVARTIEEVEKAKAEGYKRVVLAGQSYGGAISLEAGRRADVWAIIPSAPGTGVPWSEIGTHSSWNQGTTQLYSALGDTRAARAIGILPFQDEYALSSPERGRRSREIAAGRKLPYLALDEDSGLVGHGGSSSALMNFAFGACVARFLHPDFEPKKGVNLCGEGGLPVGPRRLKETDDLKPARLLSAEWWGNYQGVWTGAWTNPALLSVAIERDGNDHFLVYLRGENGTDKLLRRTRTPATLEGRNVVSQLPSQKVTLIYDNATRQVRLRWDLPDGRNGSTLLKKDRDP
ncbi:MAG: hypothetical protein NBV67_07540 [Tagaea sp.]|nr:hypothetical protein [Tagaea sp.]